MSDLKRGGLRSHPFQVRLAIRMHSGRDDYDRTYGVCSKPAALRLAASPRLSYLAAVTGLHDRRLFNFD